VLRSCPRERLRWVLDHSRLDASPSQASGCFWMAHRSPSPNEWSIPHGLLHRYTRQRCRSCCEMTKSAIENQESSPDVPPHVNLFYCMGLVSNSVVRLVSLWLLQLVVRWSISGLLLSGNVSREGIDWAISIVIYGTRVMPDAFYRTGCSECIDMTSIPTAVRYSVL
jgi:hypothetical protein